MNMRTSIAMTTFNGNKYLQEQLNSFLCQTRQPDELVVCDDGSSDNTLEILENFRQRSPFQVRIYRNEETLGYTNNFQKALLMCKGNIIFLCDQDDIWLPNKLEHMERCFAHQDRVQIAIHDCHICNDDGKLIGASLFRNRKGKRGKESLHIHGCCTVLTREMLNIGLPIPPADCGRYAHDDWLHTAGKLINARIVVNNTLQFYRRHDSNVSTSDLYSSAKPTHLERWRYYRSKLRELTDNSEEHFSMLHERINAVDLLTERITLNAGKIDAIRANFYLNNLSIHKKDLNARVALFKHKGVSRFIKACTMYLHGNYKTSSGWKSLIVDIIK